MTKSDPHAMKLARLQWELAKRKELSEEAEKEEVILNCFWYRKLSALFKISGSFFKEPTIPFYLSFTICATTDAHYDGLILADTQVS